MSEGQIIKEIERKKVDGFIIKDVCDHCHCQTGRRGAESRQIKACCDGARTGSLMKFSYTLKE